MTEPSRLPHILATSINEGRATLELAVDPDIIWFQGHFPGTPVLAGVVQIHWALIFACRYLGVQRATSADFRIKFKTTIVPNDRLTLVLAHDSAGGHLDFEYRRGDTVCSIGRAGLPS